MIPLRDGYEDNEKLLEILRNYEGEPNVSMVFSSCNYNTFIGRIEDVIFVETCNNHPFYDVLENDVPRSKINEMESRLGLYFLSGYPDYMPIHDYIEFHPFFPVDKLGEVIPCYENNCGW
jgi:hypothetical protein